MIPDEMLRVMEWILVSDRRVESVEVDAGDCPVDCDEELEPKDVFSRWQCAKALRVDPDVVNHLFEKIRLFVKEGQHCYRLILCLFIFLDFFNEFCDISGLR